MRSPHCHCFACTSSEVFSSNKKYLHTGENNAITSVHSTKNTLRYNDFLPCSRRYCKAKVFVCSAIAGWDFQLCEASPPVHYCYIIALFFVLFHVSMIFTCETNSSFSNEKKQGNFIIFSVFDVFKKIAINCGKNTYPLYLRIFNYVGKKQGLNCIKSLLCRAVINLVIASLLMPLHFSLLLVCF